jgi:hypothetical protein
MHIGRYCAYLSSTAWPIRPSIIFIRYNSQEIRPPVILYDSRALQANNLNVENDAQNKVTVFAR